MWLQIHRPEVEEVDPSAQARMAIGNEVGALARVLLSPADDGTLFDAQKDGYATIFTHSLQALEKRRPLFEAGFQYGSIFAFVDALLPSPGPSGWRLVEVKSATTVKNYHRDDLAIQVFILLNNGVVLDDAAVATIDSSWTYAGDGDYRGLLKESSLLEEVAQRADEVRSWMDAAELVSAGTNPPEILPGEHCKAPFSCPFLGHCSSAAEYAHTHNSAPIEWLPGTKSQDLRSFIEARRPQSMVEIPDELLKPLQRRVKQATLSNTPWIDRALARKELTSLRPPLHFLDFEAVQFAIPRWAGSRPYEQIPFQYSLHSLFSGGQLRHCEFLDLTGQDPRRALAEQLVEDLSDIDGAVIAYNKGFESMVLRSLAKQFKDLAPRLEQIHDRLADLLPITRSVYYHPLQRGSWSIKRVLPTLPCQAGYSELGDVADGQAAVLAYLEALRLRDLDPEAVQRIRHQLLAYCRKDTEAMIAVWEFLQG
jgi:hypothetical protein